MPKHGELINGTTRWCETCNHEHGPLYACPHYPEEVLKEIKQQHQKFKDNLNNEEWVKSQIDNGVPPEAIEAFKFFTGK